MLFQAHIGPRDAVGTSDDLERILALPRRAPVELDAGSVRAAALVEVMTARLRRPDRPSGAACGCAALGRRCLDRLLPAQAWALWEAPLACGGRGGLLAPVSVGYGKTLLDILMARVIPDCKVAVLFVPPGLVAQLETEYIAIREHFIVPSLLLPDGTGHLVAGQPVVRVVPYSRLCRPESSDLLDKLGADLFIADEVHRLKRPDAAQTRRVIRYLAARPDTRLCGWSGTITKDSIEDFAHLAAFALGDGSPVPLDPDVVGQWAAALDPSDWQAPPGALTRLVSSPGETVLQAVGKRVRETFGVVSTGRKTSSDATVILRERKAPPPSERLRELAKQLRSTWTRPDGEELLDAMAVERCAVEMISGFYYRWRFPGHPEPELVEDWFAARKAWGKEMRAKLAEGKVHLDSDRLLKNAAERAWRGDYEGDLPLWKADSWPRWRDIKDSVKHVTEAVWIDEYLAEDAAAWGTKNKGIVWYESTAFGVKVAELSGLPLHCGGPKAAAALAAEKGDRSIVASITAHHEGRNGLQFIFDEQLITSPMPSGKAWEQLLGRLSRTGQESDEVITEVYRHAPEFRSSVDKAVREAKYVDGLLTANQMLLAATVEWPL